MEVCGYFMFGLNAVFIDLYFFIFPEVQKILLILKILSAHTIFMI